MRKNVITLFASVIAALGAAMLTSSSTAEARMFEEFKCSGPPPGSGGADLGCYKGAGGCWMAAFGPHPDTGELGCWTALTAGPECCRPELEQ